MDPTLQEKISSLRDYITGIDGLPDSTRDDLLSSLDELESGPPEENTEEPGPMARLEESMLELEARHPDATIMVKSLADILGRMGL